MASSTKPSLVFVTGSFVNATHYTTLLDLVKAKGYDAQVVQLKTADKKPGPLPTMYDDAELINSVITKLADEGKDVVVAAHSYGGLPSSQSLKGVTKAEREKEGKQGGVVRIGYISALVPELGKTAPAPFEGTDAPSGYSAVDDDGWFYHTDKSLTIAYCFNSLTPEHSLVAFEDFVQHSSISFANELTHAGYKDVPVSWFFCEDDKCVVPGAQQNGIDAIEKASGKKVEITRNFSDHCPEISTPENLANWLTSLIEKGGRE